MQKITNLHRLNPTNKLVMLGYLLKRVLRLKTTEDERNINEYYFHLISFNGFSKEESDKYFVSDYPDFGVTIKLRKML